MEVSPCFLSYLRALLTFRAHSVIGFTLILLFVPETKALSLEELDQGMSPNTSAALFWTDEIVL